ncbi:MAG: HEAT repeat domain-containing protein [Planctomycetota bacterium]
MGSKKTPPQKPVRSSRSRTPPGSMDPKKRIDALGSTRFPRRHALRAGVSSDVDADRRVAAAVALGEAGDAEARRRLRELLTDPDVIVRRVAAEALFGSDALHKAMAERYGYLLAIAAEEETDRLAGVIRSGGKAAQYEATRKLILLGRPAVWELHRLCHDESEAVVGSALYALTEISAAVPNTPPVWATEVERELSKKVDFDFEETPFADALKFLSTLSEIPIRLEEGYPDGDEPVSLRVIGMPLGTALSLLSRLRDSEYEIADGGIEVRQMRFCCGTVMYWLDVRDLEAAGAGRDWTDAFNENVFPDTRWVGDAYTGSWLENHDGLLMIMVPTCSTHKTHGGREKLVPIYDYLDRLREETGLAAPDRASP